MSVPTELPPILLARPGLRTSKELWSSIFDEDYSYFSNKFEEYLHDELTKLTYHTRQASFVVAFGAVMQGGILLPYIL